MLIQPSSTIKLYHNVPLDNKYTNTIYFSGLENQIEYFHNNASILKKIFLNQSYQRVERGKMRIEVKADDIYDCNYLAFQNVSFGTKWFYAFIISIEYISNTVSEVEFEIDVMQTWLFDVTLKQCFVAREHSVSDVIGEHTLSEPFSDFQYVTNYHERAQYSDTSIAILCNVDAWVLVGEQCPYSNIWAGKFNNLRSGLFFIYGLTAQQVQETIQYYADSEKANVSDILTVFEYPTLFATESTTDSPRREEHTTPLPILLDGYSPRNKKLFTYPYNYIHVTVPSGQSQDFRYEYFDGTPTFYNYGLFYPSVDAGVIPKDYNNGGTPSFNYALHYSPSLELGFSADSYSQWKAGNKLIDTMTGVQQMSSTLNGLETIATGVVSNNPVSIARGTQQVAFGQINAELSKANAQNLADKQGNIPVGSVGHELLNMALRNNAPTYESISVKKEMLRVLDDFFDRFGYATNRVKTPNTHSRPHWNYVQTKGCIVVGNAPASDISAIEQIYDNGITFWKHGNEVGNYSLNNSPS